MKTSKFFDSRFFPLVFLPVSFIFLLIYSIPTSPLYADQGGDSGIFRLIGLGINQGKLPYLDLFDHKGPIIFYIDALGSWLIPGKAGIFLLQIFSLAVTLYLIYRIVCFIADRKISFAVTLLTLIPLIDILNSGNQCEEWMLPFISFSLYKAVSWLISEPQGHHPVWNSLIYGICFSVLFFIRPNDAVASIGAIMSGVFLLMLVRKMYMNAFYNVLSFFAGCALVAVPICLYFAYKGILPDMLDATIFYNIRYASAADIRTFSWGILAVVLVVMGSSMYIVWKDSRLSRLNYIFIPYCIFTLILIGKRDYWHYLMPIMPYISMLLALLCTHRLKVAAAVMCILFLGFGFHADRQVADQLRRRDEISACYARTDALFEQVPECQRDSVWNYNVDVAVFLNAGVVPCNRVFVPYHIYNFDESERIDTHYPKWVLRAIDGEDSGSAGFIESNYELISEADCKYRIGIYRRIDENIETDDR